jgi:glyoxylase-like metal-dependent hydrolase (beta-lactamase superfamily II)
MQIEPFFDPATFTFTYVVFDQATRDAVVIDPVLDFDPVSATTKLASAKDVLAFIRTERLRVHWILETHAHADHLSSSQFLQRELGAKIAIGARITEVQSTFAPVFGLENQLRLDGGQFDHLLRAGERLRAGTLDIAVIETPGHTPACVSFHIQDAVFTGDALFIEDYGTGRCDFPRGSADELYTSVHDKLYALPDETRVFVGHDYQPGGRPVRYATTIGASKRGNVQLRADTSREEFVAFRKARDATLSPPRLLFPSVQVNIDAGRLPAASPERPGLLRLPLNFLTRVDESDGLRPREHR